MKISSHKNVCPLFIVKSEFLGYNVYSKLNRLGLWQLTLDRQKRKFLSFLLLYSQSILTVLTTNELALFRFVYLCSLAWDVKRDRASRPPA